MRSLDGFLPGDHLLSTGRAFERLDPKVRALVTYEPQALWKLDHSRFTQALGEYRRRMRGFAQSVLRPHALELDCDTHGPKSTEILAEAARQGLLSDLLPAPFGDVAPAPGDQTTPVGPEHQNGGAVHRVRRIGNHDRRPCSGDHAAIADWECEYNSPARNLGEQSKPKWCRAPVRLCDYRARWRLRRGGQRGRRAYRPLTTAKQANGGWIINGRKVFISGGDVAHGVTVLRCARRRRNGVMDLLLD